jgi:hypothetical protein
MPTNGHANRHLGNWIDAFVEQTANLNAPKIFRVWTAISTIAAALEQKVWIRTSRPQYPNLYTFIIAHPGVGKSRTIAEGRNLVTQLPDFFLAPVSLTFAALIDSLELAKRSIIRQPEGEITYNSMYICADEMGTFIHKYEPEMIDGLSHFYDTTPYQQERRGREHKTKIGSPQLNILAGSTPQNLTGFMPEKAWGQGFTSRIIMVFSDERILGDDFADTASPHTADLAHDLKIINSLYGEFHVTQSYKDAINQWQSLGFPPTPDHPKLMHYITRRKVHIYKLSMVASVNESSGLVLTEAHFLTALEWLVQAETHMPDIFKAGAMNADASAMDEIQHYVRVNDLGTGIDERRIVNEARKLIPITSILRVVDIMTGSGQLIIKRIDKRTGLRYFSAAPIRESMNVPDPAATQPGPEHS